MWPYGLWPTQAPLSEGFSEQEHWSGLPCPPPRGLPDPGIEPVSPAIPELQADSLSPSPRGSLPPTHVGYLEVWQRTEKVHPGESSRSNFILATAEANGFTWAGDRCAERWPLSLPEAASTSSLQAPGFPTVTWDPCRKWEVVKCAPQSCRFTLEQWGWMLWATPQGKMSAFLERETSHCLDSGGHLLGIWFYRSYSIILYTYTHVHF